MIFEEPILIIEDERILADWMAGWLRNTLRAGEVHIAADSETGLELAREMKPRLILLDIGLPRADGLELIPSLRRLVPRARILVLSAQIEPYAVYRVMSSGVNGFVDKPAGADVLERAVRTVLAGKTFYSPAFQAVREELLDSPHSFQKILSRREQQVLQRMASGWSDQAIAEHAGISPQTVAAHRKSMRNKLDAHSDRELLAYALRWGIRPLSRRDSARA